MYVLKYLQNPNLYSDLNLNWHFPAQHLSVSIVFIGRGYGFGKLTFNIFSIVHSKRNKNALRLQIQMEIFQVAVLQVPVHRLKIKLLFGPYAVTTHSW